ncbi:unnamed protein product, partial [Polarella glacialis]
DANIEQNKRRYREKEAEKKARDAELWRRGQAILDEQKLLAGTSDGNAKDAALQERPHTGDSRGTLNSRDKSSARGYLPGFSQGCRGDHPSSDSPEPTDHQSAEREEFLRQIAGDPGSIFWNPHHMKADLHDLLDQMHTHDLDQMLHENLKDLTTVTDANKNLDENMNRRLQMSEELHTAANGMVEGLQSRLEKADQKSGKSMMQCQTFGFEMAKCIRSAILTKEKIRQSLLSELDLAITDEKRAMLEERRRMCHELTSKLIDVRRREEEEGSGTKTPPHISELKERILRKDRKHAKLKVVHEGLQLRVVALEKALGHIELGNFDNITDVHVLEIIEEAKGNTYQRVFTPLIRKLEQQYQLDLPDEELPDELVARKDELEAQIAEVDDEIAKIAELEVATQGYLVTMNQVPMVGGGFSCQTADFGGMFEVSNYADAMPQFTQEEAQKLKANLQREVRILHRELHKLSGEVPSRYSGLLNNAIATCRTMQTQRENFLTHLRNLKQPFLKDLRSVIPKNLTPEQAKKFEEEDRLLAEVTEAWCKEEARLAGGCTDLTERAKFIETMAEKGEQEMRQLLKYIEKNRWACSDKLAGTNTHGDSKEPVSVAPSLLFNVTRKLQKKKTLSLLQQLGTDAVEIAQTEKLAKVAKPNRTSWEKLRGSNKTHRGSLSFFLDNADENIE